MGTMLPIDHDVLTGVRDGDEHALESLFRARYAALAADAAAALGDAGAAPKVVEGAFVHLWADRDKVDSAETLDAMLADALKSCVARERSRRAAAHRMAGHETSSAVHAAAAPVTVDDAWAHLAAKLHGGAQGAHSAQAQDELHTQLRHDAAVHMAALGKRPAWQLPTLIAVVLGLAIFGTMRWFDRASADTGVTQALQSPDGRTVSTLVAQSAGTTLADESKVTLSADTKLRVPPTFGSGAHMTRAVRVDGAAAFDVPAAGETPLTIRAGDASITASGAALDVRHYATDSAASVRVRTGQATVKSLATGASQTLSAGQAVSVSNAGAIAPLGTGAGDAFGWADGRFSVTNRPLRDVLPLLVRWYGLDVKVTDAALLDRPVTVQTPLTSSREAIAAIEQTANATFGYEGKTMTFTAKP